MDKIFNNIKFRLITSNTKSAKMNMAIDKALVKSFEIGDMPILRFYSWEQSFTLGISQKIENYLDLLSLNKNYAKRITGGGVLFHGHDISYCLIIPVSYMNHLNVKQSYEKICTFLLEFYNNLGLKSMYAKDDKNIKLSNSDFCQVGFEAYDILINGIKIGGNAQKRTKKLIFQHGSIPVKKIEHNIKSTNKLEFGKTLYDFNIKLSYDEAIVLLQQAFKNVFDVQIETSELSFKEKITLKSLLQNK